MYQPTGDEYYGAYDQEEYYGEGNEQWDPNYGYEEIGLTPQQELELQLEQQLREAFAKVDEEGKGAVDLGEIDTLCKHMKQRINEKQLSDAYDELDVQGDMQIHLEDFISWYKDKFMEKIEEPVEEETVVNRWEEVIDENGERYYYNTVTEEVRWELPPLVQKIMAKLAQDDEDVDMDMKIRTLFAKYDADGTGTMDVDEFEDFIAALGAPLHGKELEDLLNTLDPSGDQLISTDEFLVWWENNAPQKKRVKAKAGSDWEQVYDADGNVYYYNTITGESQWNPPGFANELNDMLKEKYGDTGLTFEEQIEKVFEEFDVDGTGEVDVSELGELMAALNQPMKGKQLKEAMASLDVNGDGSVSRSEFVEWWKDMNYKHELGDWEEAVDEDGTLYYYNPVTGESQWEMPQFASKMEQMLQKYGDEMDIEDKIRRIFISYDTDGSGTIGEEEFQSLCKTLGQPLEGEALEKALLTLDASGDGFISSDEFVEWWCQKLNKDKIEAEEQEQIQLEDLVRAACTEVVGESIGVLDLNHISRVSAILGRPLKGKALLKAIRQLDENGQRVVDIDALVEWWIPYDRRCQREQQLKREEERALKATDLWEEVEDGEGGFYYLNSRTGEIQWENPSMQKGMEAMVGDAKSGNKTDKIKEIFRKFDKDGSGSIDRDELYDLTVSLGQPLNDIQLDAAMESMDTSGDGEIGIDEFITWWTCFQRRNITKKVAEPPAPEPSEGLDYDSDDSEIDNHMYMPEPKKKKGLFGKLTNLKESMSVKLEMTKDDIRSQGLKATLSSSGQSFKDKIGGRREDSDNSDDNKSEEFSDVESYQEEEDIIEQTKFFAGINVVGMKRDILTAMQDLIEVVISITPMGLPDAAAVIQRAFRAKVARRQLVEALQNRYTKHTDPISGHVYYLNRLTGETRWDEPIVLGKAAEILTPRSRLHATRERRRMKYKRNWFDLNQFSQEMTLSGGVYFRSAAFIVYDVLCAIKSRIKLGIWNALDKGDLTLAQLVIHFYPKQLEKRGHNEYLPPHFAAKRNLPIPLLQSMIQGRDSTFLEKDRTGHTPLHLAARDGASLEMVKVLLCTEGGREACAVTSMSSNLPIHLALYAKAPLEVIKAIVNSYSPQILANKNRKRHTPLHCAVEKFHSIEVVQYVMHAYPKALLLADKNGNLPLHLAIARSVPEDTVLMLLNECPESTLVRNWWEVLPIHFMLKQASYYSPSAILRLYKAMIDLVPEDSNQGMLSSKGYPALHYALKVKSPFPVIEALLNTNRNFAKIAVEKTGDYPLHIAAGEYDNPDFVKLLIDANTDAMLARNKKDQIPIHIATNNGKTENVAVLLHFCPWSLTERTKQYDLLMMSCSNKHAKKEMVDSFLNPPPLAPRIPRYEGKDTTPFYMARMQPNTDLLPLVQHTDIATENEMLRLAKHKLRAQHHQPNPKWDFPKIIRLIDLNPINEVVISRSLLAMHHKVMAMSEEKRRDVIVEHDLVRIVNQLLFEFTEHHRVMSLALACINQLLPSPAAKEWYRCNVDRYFNL